ncbi:hypothetical protein [Acetobacter sp.]|uniref:hypothetical protein n=1 Tax=Acetobacter sp. TaxID=440 RepID=UPI0039EC51D8
MATGDLSDISSRIRSALPQFWFPSEADNNTPVLDAILAGLAWPWAMMYMLLTYTQQQTRIDTSTGNFIDIISSDYFGDTLPRLVGEDDASYIARIKKNFFTKRNTRPAFDAEISDATGIVRVREPWRSNDCGAYGTAAYDNANACYGSRTAPGCVFVEVAENADLQTVSQTLLAIKSEGVDVFIVEPLSSS